MGSGGSKFGGADQLKFAHRLKKLELRERGPAGIVIQEYSELLAYYLLLDDVGSAKFLWEKVPEAMKQLSPEFEAVWTVGKRLWGKDIAGFYEAVNAFPWTQQTRPLIMELSDKFREQWIHVIGTAYSSTRPRDVPEMLQLSSSDIEGMISQRICPKGWRIQDGMIDPKDILEDGGLRGRSCPKRCLGRRGILDIEDGPVTKFADTPPRQRRPPTAERRANDAARRRNVQQARAEEDVAQQPRLNGVQGVVVVGVPGDDGQDGGPAGNGEGDPAAQGNGGICRYEADVVARLEAKANKNLATDGRDANADNYVGAQPAVRPPWFGEGRNAWMFFVTMAILVMVFATMIMVGLNTLRSTANHPDLFTPEGIREYSSAAEIAGYRIAVTIRVLRRAIGGVGGAGNNDDGGDDSDGGGGGGMGGGLGGRGRSGRGNSGGEGGSGADGGDGPEGGVGGGNCVCGRGEGSVGGGQGSGGGAQEQGSGGGGQGSGGGGQGSGGGGQGSGGGGQGSGGGGQGSGGGGQGSGGGGQGSGGGGQGSGGGGQGSGGGGQGSGGVQEQGIGGGDVSSGGGQEDVSGGGGQEDGNGVFGGEGETSVRDLEVAEAGVDGGLMEVTWVIDDFLGQRRNPEEGGESSGEEGSSEDSENCLRRRGGARAREAAVIYQPVAAGGPEYRDPAHLNAPLEEGVGEPLFENFVLA